MSKCWFCYWGWPKPVADIYLRALKRLDGDQDALQCGPGHIVWSDENFDMAQRCIEIAKPASEYQMSQHDYDIVMDSLRELTKVETKYLDWPEEYDGEHPDQYPPPSDWEMVRV